MTPEQWAAQEKATEEGVARANHEQDEKNKAYEDKLAEQAKKAQPVKAKLRKREIEDALYARGVHEFFQ